MLESTYDPFVQRNTKPFTCYGCNSEITHEMHGLAKLNRDDKVISLPVSYCKGCRLAYDFDDHQPLLATERLDEHVYFIPNGITLIRPNMPMTIGELIIGKSDEVRERTAVN